MAELHLTINTNILMVALGNSDRKCHKCHKRLKEAIEAKVFLAFDGELEKKGAVLVEYEQKIGEGTPGQDMAAFFSGTRFIRFFGKPSALPRKLRVELENAHFDQGDHKFVRLAMTTKSKCLVTSDDDYSPKVNKILRHAGIDVRTAESTGELF